MANLAAYDFGYVSTSTLMDRTSNTLDTLQKLERYSGHFYNWYDTQTLATLHPRYISTVDSGNLAGNMLTLQQGFLQIPHQKIISSDLFEGIYDTVRILAAKLAPEDKPTFLKFESELEAIYSEPLGKLKDIKNDLDRLDASLSAFLSKSAVKSSYETSEWADSLVAQIKGWQAELKMVAGLVGNETVPSEYADLSLFNGIPTLHELAKLEKELHLDDSPRKLTAFENAVLQTSQLANVRIIEIQKMAANCAEYAEMEYDFLYDKSQHLLAIGYNAEDHIRDNSFYDLLASEARLGIFVAIAQGKIPQDSWFALGRSLTSAEGTPVLLSWSGSMFEYLMPNLIMPSYENTLLDESCRGVVKKQIEYGRQQGVHG